MLSVFDDSAVLLTDATDSLDYTSYPGATAYSIDFVIQSAENKALQVHNCKVY